MRIDLTGRTVGLLFALGLSAFSPAEVSAQTSRPVRGIRPGIALEAISAESAGELAITGISSLLVSDDLSTISVWGICVRNNRATAASNVQIEFWVSGQMPTIGGDERHSTTATYTMGLVQGSTTRCADSGAIPMNPPDPGMYWFSVALYEGSGASRQLQDLLTIPGMADFGGPFYTGGLFFETPASYDVTNGGDSISVRLDSIQNTGGAATRELALGVWATKDVLRFGAPLPGEAVAWKTYPGLAGSSQYTNVDTGTLASTRPAPGTYWISVVLIQLGADGKSWEESCVYNFSTPFTFTGAGTTPSAAGTWILPSSARAPGAGAFWTTDLTVMNTGDEPAAVAIRFLGHGADGLGGPERSYSLGPRSTLSWPDVLGGMFGLDTDWGPILIRASVTSIVAQGQTWTACSSGGSYGQSVPALGTSEAVGPSPKAIAGIRQDSAFRTNIVLANLTETGASVSLTILRQDGSTLATKTVALGPLGFRQLGVGSDFGISSLPSGSVLVTSDGQVAAYASVIDNVTADPRTLVAR